MSYMFEHLPKRVISTAITTFFVLQALIGAFFGVYFTWISNNWICLGLTGLIFQLLGTITIFTVPESPKWLNKKGMLAEA